MSLLFHNFIFSTVKDQHNSLVPILPSVVGEEPLKLFNWQGASDRIRGALFALGGAGFE
jgi:hypothetical protein